MRIGVAGASGFVGRALVSALTGAGHDVVAIARRAPRLPGAEGRAVDVADGVALRGVLEGCHAAYYLVHSLAAGDFRERDMRLAESFGRASGSVGVGRIVYLGGLGHEPGSEHLASPSRAPDIRSGECQLTSSNRRPARTTERMPA